MSCFHKKSNCQVYSRRLRLCWTEAHLCSKDISLSLSLARSPRSCQARSEHESYLTAKRIMDITLVLVGLPVVLPIMILCAILIKLEDPRGPIFFIQPRTGKGGRRFGMYKFRSMIYNAEELKQKYLHLNELQWPDFKIDRRPAGHTHRP